MDKTIETAIENAKRKEMITRSIGKIVRHFKGDFYLIEGIAQHTESGDKLVIYRALYDDCKVYARPLDMFIEKVPEGKPNPTGQEYRLELVDIPSIKDTCELIVTDINTTKGE